MAHIPDGVLAAPVLIAGATATVALLAVGVRRLDDERIPRAAMLAAVFFVASLIHLPLGPTSVHPLLVGLMGLVLGWAAVPTVVVALLLQAVFFGFGGVTSLGVNAFNVAMPALVVGALIRPMIQRSRDQRIDVLLGVVAGALGVVLCAALVCASLALSNEGYRPAVGVVAASYLPLAVIEGLLTGAVVKLLTQVKPELIRTATAVRG